MVSKENTFVQLIQLTFYILASVYQHSVIHTTHNSLSFSDEGLTIETLVTNKQLRAVIAMDFERASLNYSRYFRELKRTESLRKTYSGKQKHLLSVLT